MRTETPQPIRLADYRPPAFLVDTIELDFDLKPSATRVRAKLALRRNGEHAEPLVLNGERPRLALLGRLLRVRAQLPRRLAVLVEVLGVAVGVDGQRLAECRAKLHRRDPHAQQGRQPLDLCARREHLVLPGACP